ncbi:DUF3021 domain-containing protein [Allofustis seminis]|uniref:DUF3021 domain-containing protein n=1 Tax=Allofustis seminis TaxID=166939 RepID=UPI0003763AE3|nr:DUF3021 domain-containing protein [Allofustis seminis]
MLKEIMKRAAVGMLMGAGIGFLTPLTISYFLGTGNVHLVTPPFLAKFDTEIQAVIVQTIFTMIIGAVFSVSGLLYESIDSLPKKTALHFILTLPVLVGSGYYLYWMDHTVRSVISFVMIAIVIYAAIWVGTYYTIKKNVEQVNQKLKQLH